MLLMLFAVVSWDQEYAGFVHFRNWDGTGWPGVQKDFSLPGPAYPTAVAMDVCASAPNCNRFSTTNTYGTNFGHFVNNDSFDVYIAVNTSIVPAAICYIATVAGCSTEKQWLHCATEGIDDQSPTTQLNHFALPPDLIHSSCLANKECLAFRVNNDGGSGTLYKRGGWQSDGYFMIQGQLKA